MPGKHQTAWALEKDGAFWWFDAGENCSRTAHLQGYDVRKIKKLFISHSHGDHTAGLYHLFMTMAKLNSLARNYDDSVAIPATEFECIVPDPEIVGFLALASCLTVTLSPLDAWIASMLRSISSRSLLSVSICLSRDIGIFSNCE